MTIDLRLATTDDIPALQELIPVSVRALSQGYYTPAQIESALIHVFGVDTQLIEDGTYYVAEDTGQIVGAGGWSKRKTLYGGDQSKGEADPLLDPARDAAHIRAFYVHPDWARRGIGSSLMRACELAAREAGFTRMDLGSTLAGESLYAAMGFHVRERVDISLPDGQSLPAAMMEKQIQ
ncbi:MAG TPA: GNAT family N-acetyltransferase [Ktedonobacterales bacterium]|jgi:GNAT superfamily N-acetyltransferase|nr:GNAT family N-acetyltransferase [Ktedonobacterales bacterium]